MSRYQIVVSLYSYPKRIAEAKRILSIDEQDSGSPIFPALSAILFAVALEDGINSTIADRCANAAASQRSNHLFEPLRENSLRQRMTVLADVVGHKFFRLPAYREHSKALHELVSLRNRLLHIKEVVHSLDEQSEGVELIEDALQVSVGIPQDPWSEVTKKQAEQFGQAVELYIEEVLGPLADGSKYWD